jgi:hydroxymethylpyrimidine/phosphomethylpyrimidine kinase
MNLQATVDSMTPHPKPPIVWTIAGFDPSNGAGITADLQVFAAHGLFGMSAITALTVQSTLGVAAVEPVKPEVLRQTLRHLAADVKPAGIKIGMLGSREAVLETVGFLGELSEQAKGGPGIPIVLDPVLRSSSGASLLEPTAMNAILEELLPRVSWITPNRSELGILAGMDTSSDAGREAALAALGERYPTLHIVATGGDSEGQPVDLWRAPDGLLRKFTGQRVETTSTHGTGCAFSSALLSRVVIRHKPEDSIQSAKTYVERSLRSAPGIGQGRGPMDLLWPLREAGTTNC